MDTFTPNFFEFPNITYDLFVTTSPKDIYYNCIAFAAGDMQRWWWPDGGYWPTGVSRDVELQSFIDAYATLGYAVCDNAEYETGFEKVAIYALADGTPTHAARQISADHWVSKIGQNNDIRHDTLEAIGGGLYGSAQVFMKRSNVQTP